VTSTWPSTRLKNLARIAFSSVDKKSVEGEVPAKLCNYRDVYYNDEITSGLEFMEATASSEQIRLFSLRAGDCVITKDSETPDDIGVPAFVPEDLEGVVCGYHLAVIRPRIEQVDPKFLFWVLSSQHARDRLAVSASGVTRYGLRFGDVGNLPVFLPSLPEQRRIADFLDRETTRIGAAITALTKVRRTVLEREQVIAGELLTPDANRVPLKRVIEFKEGPGIMAQDFRDEGVPLIRISGLKDGRVTLAGCNFLEPQMVARRWSQFSLRDGDYVLSASASMGLVSRVDAEADGAIPYTGLIRIRPKLPDINVGFVKYFLASRVFMNQIEGLRTGVGIEHYGPTHLARVTMPLPSRAEQAAIAERLDSLLNFSVTLGHRIEREADLLEERRRTLIADGVTGQL
jgi:type I restriction enzyme, S subunit